MRRRVLAIAAAVLLVTTILYGERWLLAQPSTACVECAVTTGVARVLDGNSADN
jgi:hypothetical protein